MILFCDLQYYSRYNRSHYNRSRYNTTRYNGSPQVTGEHFHPMQATNPLQWVTYLFGDVLCVSSQLFPTSNTLFRSPTLTTLSWQLSFTSVYNEKTCSLLQEHVCSSALSKTVRLTRSTRCTLHSSQSQLWIIICRRVHNLDLQIMQKLIIYCQSTEYLISRRGRSRCDRSAWGITISSCIAVRITMKPHIIHYMSGVTTTEHPSTWCEQTNRKCHSKKVRHKYITDRHIIN